MKKKWSILKQTWIDDCRFGWIVDHVELISMGSGEPPTEWEGKKFDKNNSIRLTMHLSINLMVER